MTYAVHRGRKAVALAAFVAFAACRAAWAAGLLTSCENPGPWTFAVTRDSAGTCPSDSSRGMWEMGN